VSQHIAPEHGAELDPLPYASFDHAFREVVAAHRVKKTKALLHVVFGNIADVRGMPVVIPVNESFDLRQRGSRSVLASFEPIYVGKRAFFDYVEETWPTSRRPTAAGLGNTKYLSLPKNTRDLPGILFVVTTRNLSANTKHYGYYVNTPVEGIDYIIEHVLDAADAQRLSAIAIPLLGAGYANIRRTFDQEKLGRLMRQAVALLTIQKTERKLADASSVLRRGVVVVFSKESHSEEEHHLWESVTRFLGKQERQRQFQLDALLNEISKA